MSIRTSLPYPSLLFAAKSLDACRRRNWRRSDIDAGITRTTGNAGTVAARAVGNELCVCHSRIREHRQQFTGGGCYHGNPAFGEKTPSRHCILFLVVLIHDFSSFNSIFQLDWLFPPPKYYPRCRLTAPFALPSPTTGFPALFSYNHSWSARNISGPWEKRPVGRPSPNIV